jgi:hypothetical protein
MAKKILFALRSARVGYAVEYLTRGAFTVLTMGPKGSELIDIAAIDIVASPCLLLHDLRG